MKTLEQIVTIVVVTVALAVVGATQVLLTLHRWATG